MSNMKIVLAVLATVLLATGYYSNNNQADHRLEMKSAIELFFIDEGLSSDQATFLANSCLNYRTHEYEIDAEKHGDKYMICESDHHDYTLTFVLNESNQVIELQVSKSIKENQTTQ